MDKNTVILIWNKTNGGTDDINNLVPACRRCNSAKGGRSLEDFRILQQTKSFKTKHNISFSIKQIKFLRKTYNLDILPEKYLFWFEENKDKAMC